jgi:thiosulfate reductase cytochrome b subunit
MMKKPVQIYTSFERFWHWMQAILVLFLAFTGFEIHGSVRFFGFEEAVKYHNIAAYLLLALIVFAIFWHFTTGQWRQYVPVSADSGFGLAVHVLPLSDTLRNRGD